MITIPTCELTGLLGDVIPFAVDNEKIVHLSCIQLAWDGEQLHAYATDQARVAWSSWHPADDPDVARQDSLWAEWGGTDDPWTIVITLHDAKHLVTVFKLTTKQGGTPLQVEYTDGRVTVSRSAQTGHSALTATIEHLSSVDFVDIRAVLMQLNRPVSVPHMAYNADLLADFASVRPRGPMTLTFMGPRQPTLVEIGQRFIGAIRPAMVENDMAGGSSR